MASAAGRWPLELERRVRYMIAEHGEGAPEATAGVVADPTTERVAVLSSPRSGNTFLRSVLALSLDAVPASVHHPADLDWSNLPPRVVLQLHWPRTGLLQRLLRDAGVRIVTVVRHPFDILLSVLRYAQLTPGTAEWLWGDDGDEDELVDAHPGAASFTTWAVGPRAAALLEVTKSWLTAPGVARVEYERLTSAPEATVEALLEGWGLSPRVAVADAVGLASPSVINKDGVAHARRDSSLGWQELLPSSVVEALAQRYSTQLEALGMTAGRHGDLDRVTRLERWASLSPGPRVPCAEEAYRGGLAVIDPPTEAVAGGRLHVLARVENRSPVLWPHRNRTPRFVIGYRWTDEAGGALDLERRVPLLDSIEPGDALYQPVALEVPLPAGQYLLEVGLVHEHVRWFAMNPPVTVEVR